MIKSKLSTEVDSIDSECLAGLKDFLHGDGNSEAMNSPISSLPAIPHHPSTVLLASFVRNPLTFPQSLE